MAQLQLKFDFGLKKKLTGSFDGGLISSDGGLGLVRLADEQLKLTESAAIHGFCPCFADTFSSHADLDPI